MSETHTRRGLLAGALILALLASVRLVAEAADPLDGWTAEVVQYATATSPHGVTAAGYYVPESQLVDETIDLGGAQIRPIVYHPADGIEHVEPMRPPTPWELERVTIQYSERHILLERRGQLMGIVYPSDVDRVFGRPPGTTDAELDALSVRDRVALARTTLAALGTA